MSVVVDTLFNVTPIVCGVLYVFSPCFVMHFLVSFLVSNHLEEEEIACWLS